MFDATNSTRDRRQLVIDTCKDNNIKVRMYMHSVHVYVFSDVLLILSCYVHNSYLHMYIRTYVHTYVCADCTYSTYTYMYVRTYVQYVYVYSHEVVLYIVYTYVHCVCYTLLCTTHSVLVQYVRTYVRTLVYIRTIELCNIRTYVVHT